MFGDPGFPNWTKHNSKHGSFGDAAAVTYDDVCQIISNALQMKSKLQYVSMFADKLLSLEEKLCRPAAKYYWLLASKSASHG